MRDKPCERAKRPRLGDTRWWFVWRSLLITPGLLHEALSKHYSCYGRSQRPPMTMPCFCMTSVTADGWTRWSQGLEFGRDEDISSVALWAIHGYLKQTYNRSNCMSRDEVLYAALLPCIIYSRSLGFTLITAHIPTALRISSTPLLGLPGTTSVQISSLIRLSVFSTLQLGLCSALSHLKSSTWSYKFLTS